jgi:hypothetical protein
MGKEVGSVKTDQGSSRAERMQLHRVKNRSIRNPLRPILVIGIN